jgi:cytochrome b subunit of formate dehydrogenase
LPLIALITTVYPPFGHLLHTLVGPLLQALRNLHHHTILESAVLRAAP